MTCTLHTISIKINLLCSLILLFIYRDAEGDTPLCLVGFRGSTSIAKLLVEKGAEINPPVPDPKQNRYPYYVSAHYNIFYICVKTESMYSYILALALLVGLFCRVQHSC